MNQEGSPGERAMVPASPLSELLGLRSHAIGDVQGSIVVEKGMTRGSSEVVAITSVIGATLGPVGAMLGLGEATFVTVRSAGGSWVLGYCSGYSITIELDPNVPTGDAESVVAQGEWVPKSEWEISDTEIEYVTQEDTSANNAPIVSSVAPVGPPQRAQESCRVEAPRPVKPPSPKPSHTALRAARPPVVPSLAPTNPRTLRRALVRGELNDVRALALRLKPTSADDATPFGNAASARALEILITGIASALSDAQTSALPDLLEVGQMPGIEPSLQWVARVWTARIALGMLDDWDLALANAEAAGRLSKQLDTEARFVSARLIAEVCLLRNNLSHAERFIEQARRLSESLVDREEASELALLEAKILFETGKLALAIQAAERARAGREDWVAPVAFLCRCALSVSDLRRAQELVAQQRCQETPPDGIRKLVQLLEAVKRLLVPPEVAAEMLALEDTPPNPTSMARLAALTREYPHLQWLRDTVSTRPTREATA